MLTTVWFCINSKTPSLAMTMKGVSPLMRPEATSGSAVTPILSAAAQQIGRVLSLSSDCIGSHGIHTQSERPGGMRSQSQGSDTCHESGQAYQRPRGSV